jgi:hypothetical protein
MLHSLATYKNQELGGGTCCWWRCWCQPGMPKDGTTSATKYQRSCVFVLLCSRPCRAQDAPANISLSHARGRVPG